jgi:hypothetical protein
VILEGAGHYPIEQPGLDQMGDAVESFIRGQLALRQGQATLALPLFARALRQAGAGESSCVHERINPQGVSPEVPESGSKHDKQDGGSGDAEASTELHGSPSLPLDEPGRPGYSTPAEKHIKRSGCCYCHAKRAV